MTEDPPLVIQTVMNASTSASLKIPVKLNNGTQQVQLSALVDCGATGCFINQRTVEMHKLPVTRLALPLPVRVVDGREIASGAVTMITPVLTLEIDSELGTHREQIRFHITDCGVHDIILGLPWLRQHSPTIHWATSKIVLESAACNNKCFSPYIEVSAISSPPSPAVINLENDKTRTILHQFQRLFDVERARSLPKHRTEDHGIELRPNSKAPLNRIYNMSPVETEVLRTYIKDNLASGCIRPSKSDYGAPVLFVKKPESNALRLCVDYRGLNEITVKDRYPLPLISDILQQASQAKVFSKVDLMGAYNLLRIREGDEKYTAFRTKFGHFEYRVLPFGLCNAPATFQRFMDRILHRFHEFSAVYLDDILIFSPDETTHHHHLKQILNCLSENDLIAKASKCEFFKSEVRFLGYLIGAGGVRVLEDRINTINHWQPMKNVNQVQRFLGAVNYYRMFINNHALLCAPLTALLKKGVPFKWDSKQQSAFDQLKAAFATAPVLVHHNQELPCFVETDASDFALGAVLAQERPPGKELGPIAYYSRQFTPPERNYPIHDKELLAVIVALKNWRHFLQDSRHDTTVLTDHKNLEYFLHTKTLNRRQARWAEFLGEFNLRIKYRPGSSNPVADALSRQPDMEGEENSQQTMFSEDQFISSVQLAATTLDTFDNELIAQIREAQAKDLGVQKIRDRTTMPRQYSLEDNLLTYNKLIFIPENKALRLRIVEMLHDDRTAGHPGQQRTLELVSRNFFWPGMKRTINQFVASCQICTLGKSDRNKPTGLLQPLPVPDEPWDSISMDFITKLPASGSQAYDSIFVVVDRLTKMTHCIPCHESITAEQTAQLFINQIFRLHGLPLDIVSDRDPRFVSQFWNRVMQLLGIKKNLSTSGHPQTDGQTERMNQSLESYLRLYCHQNQTAWAIFLPVAEFVLNNTHSATIGMTPFFANHARHPRLNIHLPVRKSNYKAEQFTGLINLVHEKAKKAMTSAQAYHAKYYNKKHREPPIFQVGDLVYLSDQHLGGYTSNHGKLDLRKSGPYRVLARVGNLNYRLQLPETMRIHPVFHVSHLTLQKTFEDVSRAQQPVPPLIRENNVLQTPPEKILDHRVEGNQKRYLVHFKDTPQSEDTWMIFRDIPYAHNLVRNYNARRNSEREDSVRYSYSSYPHL